MSAAFRGTELPSCRVLKYCKGSVKVITRTGSNMVVQIKIATRQVDKTKSGFQKSLYADASSFSSLLSSLELSDTKVYEP